VPTATREEPAAPGGGVRPRARWTGRLSRGSPRQGCHSSPRTDVTKSVMGPRRTVSRAAPRPDRAGAAVAGHCRWWKSPEWGGTPVHRLLRAEAVARLPLGRRPPTRWCTVVREGGDSGARRAWVPAPDPTRRCRTSRDGKPRPAARDRPGDRSVGPRRGSSVEPGRWRTGRPGRRGASTERSRAPSDRRHHVDGGPRVLELRPWAASPLRAGAAAGQEVAGTAARSCRRHRVKRRGWFIPRTATGCPSRS
jgi:hypothetical protein